jgi:hypothetical protein
MGVVVDGVEGESAAGHRDQCPCDSKSKLLEPRSRAMILNSDF